MSSFRIEKLLGVVRTAVPRVSHLYAEFWHFADLSEPLDDDRRSVLDRILTYGPHVEAETPAGELFLVVPRPGTISPWSSRATDIARHCGLDAVRRLERGVAWYVREKRWPRVSTTA